MHKLSRLNVIYAACPVTKSLFYLTFNVIRRAHEEKIVRLFTAYCLVYSLLTFRLEIRYSKDEMSDPEIDPTTNALARVEILGDQDLREEVIDDGGHVSPPGSDGVNENKSDNPLETSLVDGGKPLLTEKPSFQLRKVVREEDQFKWELPDELADHFKEYAHIHYSDADMRKTLKEFPTPCNVNCIPSMDNALKSLLRKEKKANHIDVDKDWEVVQNKVQEVMGPLGDAWRKYKLYQRGDQNEIDVFQVGEILDVAVMALGHAFQNISWFRRVHSLSALGALKNVKDTLKEDKVRSIMEKDTTNNLFPKEFDEVLRSDKGKRTNLLAHFKPETPKEKKKPTSSATTTRPGGDRSDRRFVQRPSYTQRPFPANPSGSNRGGGSFYPQKSSSYNKGRQGKHAEEKPKTSLLSSPVKLVHPSLHQLFPVKEVVAPQESLAFSEKCISEHQIR